MNNCPNDRTWASESTNDASVLKQCYHIHTLPPQNQTKNYKRRRVNHMSKINLRTQAITTQDEEYFAEGPSMDDICAKRRGVLPKADKFAQGWGGVSTKSDILFIHFLFPWVNLLWKYTNSNQCHRESPIPTLKEIIFRGN